MNVVGVILLHIRRRAKTCSFFPLGREGRVSVLSWFSCDPPFVCHAFVSRVDQNLAMLLGMNGGSGAGGGADSSGGSGSAQLPSSVATPAGER